MKQRILVALDLCEPEVFETALSLAIAVDADLLLLHVFSVSTFSSSFSYTLENASTVSQQTWALYQKQWQDYVDKSLETLRAYTGRAEAAGLAADLIRSANAPGPGICSMAKTWNADMIVIGSHQRTGMRELLLGSVSNYVMHHAPCSVMVVSLENEAESKENAPSETAALAA